MTEEYEEDYDYEEDKEEDPQWRLLTPKERKKLLKNAFTNDDWYDEGSLPVHKGGDGNPLFEVLSDRVGAPLSEIKRYYAAWLNSQGFSAESALKKSPSNSVNPSENLGQYMIKDEPVSDHQQGGMGGMGGMGNISDPGLMPPPQGGNGDSMGMWAMMNFLTSQQRMAMQQQQFQMMQGMEQRKLDQNREESQRREAMARDQQFMNQQMSFMREMIKKSGDGDGFFDSDMKKIMKEKVVDQMLGGGDNGDWKDMVKDVIGSDTMKAAVGGIGGAIGSRNNTPAGYNVPGYNPYAQPIPQPIPQQREQVMHNPGIPEQQFLYEQPQPVEQPPSGYFGEENAPPQQQEVEMQEVPREPSTDEYQQALMSTLSQLMGPSLQDPKNLEAVKQQVEVAVETTLVEHPELLPQMKLIKMTEKILLILNLRDIGLGLKDLLSKTKPGQAPSNLILAVVVEQLRDRPEFYKIFAENTYEELVATIEPFKNTGTISYDYEYLLNPDVAEVCRHMLAAVAADARQKGAPPIEGM